MSVHNILVNTVEIALHSNLSFYTCHLCIKKESNDISIYFNSVFTFMQLLMIIEYFHHHYKLTWETKHY